MSIPDRGPAGAPTDALRPEPDPASPVATPSRPGSLERPADRYGDRGSDKQARTDPGPGSTSGSLDQPTIPLPTPARMRARFARFGGGRSSANPVLEPVLRSVKASHPKADTALIERAYIVAEREHRGQVRRSGDPYITHPLAVATILADLGMPPTTIAAALLHDTVEDTDYTLAELTKDFGEEIARLVDGVTKLDKVSYGEAAQAETVRKMVVAMARDIRVLVIKLADRLHNARTWRYVSASSAQKKARETLEIYAPLAHRLGMNTIKWELEDLSFAALYPKVYEEIEHLVAERAPAREEYLAGVRENVLHDLAAARIKAVVTGRPKHYYSVYQKMIVRGKEFDEIFDLVGVRVLVDSVRDCYAALGAVHARWTPVPGRFKDYIAIPKFNMYQSLHTTVIGPGGNPVEIQIRTHAMHRRAEYGVAAHWKYKEDGPNGAPPEGESADSMSWLRTLVDWQKETSDPGEFLDSLRYEIASAEVYVFTPKGEVVTLPAGSTPVDFAYAVHTEVGHRTMGGRVNGRLVPLESRLENGDVVEILTSKAPDAGPSKDWLAFVKSPRARNKIRGWFSKERREEAVDAGRDALAKQLRKQGLPVQRLMSTESLTMLAVDLHYKDISGLFAAVGSNTISAQSVIAKLLARAGGEEGVAEDAAESITPVSRNRRVRASDPGVTVIGTDDVWVKLAKCCTPLPGDDIIGFVTRGHGVSVHLRECPNAEDLLREPERLIEVAWAPSASSVFLVQIQVEGLDRNRLLSDVTRVLADLHVNLASSSSTTSANRVAIFRFTFEMGDPAHLDHVMRALRRVDGVFEVTRVGGGRKPDQQ